MLCLVVCLVVFGCVSMCQYVTICVSACCLRCVVGCVSVGVDALTVQNKNDRKNPAREFLNIKVLINSKNGPASNYEYYCSFLKNSKK